MSTTEPVRTPAPYPVRVEGRLEEPLSRWLWLVKWVLLIPHGIVLAFLWLGFVVSWVISLVAIVVTGRYPRSLFDYNLGVLRWTWRVSHYAYNALGTDRYPPFTLQDVPDHPARLDVDYPEHLSRGLALVKWWLLAIPHYIVVAVFVGGGSWLSRRDDSGHWTSTWGAGGLVGILVLIAAIVVLVRGTYPRPLYDVVLGMDRWWLRVACYAALMTDAYPPFRLDLGPSEPVASQSLATEPPVAQPVAPPVGPGPVPSAAPTSAHRWTGGRVVSLVAGAVALFGAAGLLIGGLAVSVADHVSRDAQGYLSSPATVVSSGGYAVTTEQISLGNSGPTWVYPANVLGTVRLTATASDPQRAVFVGIARTSDLSAYLSGVRTSTVRSIGDEGTTYTEKVGTAPSTSPAAQPFWVASASGAGERVLTWAPTGGNWSVVVMNADGSAGVSAQVAVAATVPALGWISTGLVVGGLVALAVGVLLVVLAIRSAGHGSAPRPPAPSEPIAA